MKSTSKIKRSIIFTIIASVAYLSLSAQEIQNGTSNLKLNLLNEMVLSANESAEQNPDVPFNIDVIKSLELELSYPQTSADMHSNIGNINVQKSQVVGESPIVRGFEARRFLINGVRMNNAIYRGVHFQDGIAIDNALIDINEMAYGR